MDVHITEPLAEAVKVSARRGQMSPQEWVRVVLAEAVVREAWRRDAGEEVSATSCRTGGCPHAELPCQRAGALPWSHGGAGCAQ